MGCEVKVFDGVVPSVMEQIREKVSSLGLDLIGDKGKVEGPMGIELEFEYNQENSTLQVQVTKKNMMISCSMIYDQLQGALDEIMG